MKNTEGDKVLNEDTSKRTVYFFLLQKQRDEDGRNKKG